MEKAKIHTWVLKEKELLEKISLEISSDFSISEKLAKKLIYKTHLSLQELKDEIITEEELIDLNEEKDRFKEENLNKLLSVLEWARKVIENSSKSEIEELKKLLEKSDLLFFEDNEIIKKLFSKKLINKAKQPKNISEQIMGASLWFVNSTFIITELLYDIWVWIITSVPDLISILKWTWEIESIKKV